MVQWWHGGCGAPVWHAHDDIVHAVLAGLVDDGLEGRDQHLAAFQAKALL